MKRFGVTAAAIGALVFAAACEKPVEEAAPAEYAKPELGKVVYPFDEYTPLPEQGDAGGPEFYYGPITPIPTKPGTLIRTEPLQAEFSLPQAGRAERILYLSTKSLSPETGLAVSGAVFLPKGDPPADGWPLIAWAHGTVGIADVCAPSNTPRSERDATYLGHWLDQGYAVVASDYEGLGTRGAHPYLVSKAEAYSVLDAIRAAQAGNYNISKKVVIVGQSQGGQAAFATAGEAAAYAPEIDIRGTVATGTPYFTATTAPAERDPNAVEGVFAYTLMILFMAQHADAAIQVDDYITPAAAPTIEKIKTACLGAVWDSVLETKLSFATAFKADPTPAVARFYPLMGYGTLAVKGPVFMGTGGQDHDVPPAGQQRLVDDACKAGAVIEHHIYPDLDHSGVVNGSLKDSTPFVAKAFAGEAIAGTCPKPQ